MANRYREMKKFLLVAVALLLLASSVPALTKAINVTYNTTNYRLGRFAVDLPRGSQVSVAGQYHGADVVDDADIRDFDALKNKLDPFAEQYLQTKMQHNLDTDELFKATGLDPAKEFGNSQLVTYQAYPERGEILFGYHPTATDATITIHLYKVSPEGSVTFAQTDRAIDNLAVDAAALQRMASSFKMYRIGEKVPAGAFCLKQGCVDDHGAQPVNEQASLRGTLGGHEDAKISILTLARVTAAMKGSDLEHEADNQIQEFSECGAHVTVLRRGQRSIAGQSGFEVAISCTSNDNLVRPAFIFAWVAAGKVQDANKPMIHFNLRIQPTSNGLSTVSTPEEALKLWDTSLNSLAPT